VSNVKLLLWAGLLSFGAMAHAQIARLQVIHNAADPVADSVDVYVNGTRLLDNFRFRTATPFINVPAGVPVNIGVAPGNSNSVQDTIKNFRVSFVQNRKYVAIANGVLSTTDFAPNPNGRNITFTLFASDNMREIGSSRRMVDLNAFHGATDAPTVDILVRGQNTPLINNATYGDFSGYKSVYPSSYVLDVTPGNDNRTIVASFRADLTGLRGGAAVVFASGFLNPATNRNGRPFGLFAALPNGTVVELPKITIARLQVIHNAADPAADSVDVYVNGTRLLDNFKFRRATPFIDVPAGVPVNIGVAGPNSISVQDTIKNFVFTFTGAKTYVAVANGVLNPSQFASNPNGRSIAFTLFAKDGIRERGVVRFLTDLIVVHGSTDAPTVDVKVRGLNFLPLVNNLTYGDFSHYLSVPPIRYTLNITPGNSNTVVASFVADLRGLGGAAAVVFASGFLDPSRNQNGPAFGLFAALPNGQIVALPPAGSDESDGTDSPALAKSGESEQNGPAEFALSQNYPNPFNPSTTISYALPNPEFVSLKVYGILGQEMATLVNEQKAAGRYTVTLDASGFASGTYVYRLQAGSFVATRKLSVLK